MSKPSPSVLFLAKCARPLDFELRAFVPDIDDRMTAFSELKLAINAALEEEGIEIPSLQNDLHLNTIYAEVQAIISQK